MSDRQQISALVVAIAAVLMPDCLIAQTITSPNPPGSGASVYGFLVDAEGQAVRGAVVSFSRIHGADTIGSASGATFSTPDGAFFLKGMSSGSFRICVSANGSEFLNPCDWSPAPPMVNLATDQLLPGLRIVLERGVRMKVRLDDSQKLLNGKPNEQKPHMLVGVFTKHGKFLGAPQTFEDAGGRNHEITVAADEELKVAMFSYALGVTDDKDKDVLQNDPSLKLRVGKAETTKLLRFKIKEKR